MRFANQYLNPALAFAFVIFAATGYMLSIFFPTTILVWDIVLIGSLIVSTGIALKFVQAEQNTKAISPLQTLLSLIPYIIFLPSIWLLLISPELQMSYHGDLHSGYVNQILYATGQPENIYLPGTTANHYWLYHALIATISDILHMPHPVSNVLLSILALVSVFGWVHRVVAFIIPDEYPPIVNSMLVIFVLFGMNLFGSLQSMVGLWTDFNIWRLWEIIAPVSISELRLTTLYSKFISYTSFPLVLVYSWIMIFVAIKIVKRRATNFDVSLFIVGIAGGTAFLFIGGALMLGTLGAAFVATQVILHFKSKPKLEDITTQLRPHQWQDAIPLVISLLSFVFIAVYATIAASALVAAGTGHSLKIIPTLQSLNNATSIFGAVYVLTPFILIGFFIAWKENDPVLLFLTFSFLTIMYGAFIFESTEYYKLIIFGSNFATLLIAAIINRPGIMLENHKSPVNMGIPLIIGMYLLVGLNIISYTGGTMLEDKARWEESRGYSYDGSLVNRANESYSDVYIWLRESVDPETVLIMRPNDTTFSAPLSHHLPFVSDVYYSGAVANTPEWGRRASLLYTLTNEAVDSPEWQSAWDTVREIVGEQAHVYVFPNDMPSDTLQDFGFEQLFEGEYASVYQYNSD